jgi:hypothetical protein
MKAAADKSRAEAEKSVLQRRLSDLIDTNKRLNETIAESSRPTKMSLEKALHRWRQELERLNLR